jgi:CBS domain-containing protein
VQVGKFCSRDVHVAYPEDALASAVRKMHEHNVGSIIVVESSGRRRPIGIVTDRDVLRGQIDRSADLFCLVVAEVMTKDPVTLPENCGVAEAVEKLSARGVRRAPVVNAAGDLVGIVTFDDLLPAIADGLNALSTLIGTQVKRPATSSERAHAPA